MAKDNPRARRLQDQIQRVLTEVLRREVKDERIGNVTITAVDVTPDLRSARVHYAIFGKDGGIQRMVSLDFKGLTAGKTKVLQFDLKGIACDGVSREMGGSTPNASAVSMMTFFGCGARPVGDALGM